MLFPAPGKRVPQVHGRGSRAASADAIHAIPGNLPAHSGAGVDKWLAGHQDVTFHFTPAGSSWLDQAEIWPGIITRQAIRRGTFGPVRPLIHAISNYIASWNEDSAPFEWNATADQIITRVAIPDRDFKKLAASNLK